MLWGKKKYSVQLRNGRGNFETEEMHGLVHHLIVIPKRNDTIWSMQLSDNEGDVVFDVKDIEGRLDDKEGLPLGGLSGTPRESLKGTIYDSTFNDSFEVIFRVKET